MKYLSLFSGIEAASVAWHDLGWQPVGFSEIDKFPSAVLAKRWPTVPNLGDITEYENWPACFCDNNDGTTEFICKCGGIDLVVGGSPCQAFSIAGLRKGLDDPRGNLMLTFGAVVRRYLPRWVVWENVPGVLSSAGGRDFATFLGLISGTSVTPPRDGWKSGGVIKGYAGAYGLAWRVLDTQFTRTPRFPLAIPQRRRRVFVVGYLGDWRRAVQALFDAESLCGNPPPRRKAGERVAGRIEGGSGERGYPDPSDGNGGGLIATFSVPAIGDIRPDDVASTMTSNSGGGGETQNPAFLVYENHPQDSRINEMGDVCSTVDARYGTGGGNVPLVAARMTAFGEYEDDGTASTLKQRDYKDATDLIAHTLRAEFDASEDGTGRGTPIIPVAFQQNQLGEVRQSHETAYTLNQNSNASGSTTPMIAFSAKDSGADAGDVAPTMRSMGLAVRRLTATECERLQGFPDGYTQISYRRKRIDQCPDGPRYKALGNSMSTNVMEWIGRRIEMVEQRKEAQYETLH